MLDFLVFKHKSNDDKSFRNFMKIFTSNENIIAKRKETLKKHYSKLTCISLSIRIVVLFSFLCC